MKRMLRRLLWISKGLLSSVRKIIEIDLHVVGYIFFGPKPPRIIYFALFVTLSSLIVAIVKNPTAGILVAVVATVVFFLFLYLAANAPPIRWHILSDNIRLVYEDSSGNKVTTTDTLHMRAMRRYCDSLNFPISHAGKLSILGVSQDGELLLPMTEKNGGSGYFLERIDLLKIKLRGVVKFGQDTNVVVRWAVTTTEPDDSYIFSANTFVDHLAITVCFHRLKYPRTITAYSEFGIRAEPHEFLAQRRAEDLDHICETWEPAEITYLHRYVLRWTW